MMHRLLRFTLDLFETEPLTPPVRPDSQKPANPPFLKQNKPPAQVERAQPAIEIIVTNGSGAPTLASQALTQALAPAAHRHPRATREALLHDVLVAYEFQRGKRRTIGFSVGPDGLAVRAPKWLPLHEIDKAVLEKSGWILKKLQEARSRNERLEAARMDWADGAALPFLGQQVTLVIDPRHAFGGVGVELKSSQPGALAPGQAPGLPAPPALSLHIGLPHSAGPEQIRDAVQAWLMRQAKRIFTERLNHFAPPLNVKWHKLSLSNAGTRWGSASSNGSIRLNWRLIHFKQSVIDYVVVHELSHLRVMDHSPRFWDTVREVVPDYAKLRNQLKNDAIPRW